MQSSPGPSPSIHKQQPSRNPISPPLLKSLTDPHWDKDEDQQRMLMQPHRKSKSTLSDIADVLRQEEQREKMMLVVDHEDLPPQDGLTTPLQSRFTKDDNTQRHANA